jgi:hypothetical protein
VIKDFNRKLFEQLQETKGMYIQLYPDRGGQKNLRRGGGSRAADFQPELMREKDGKN